MPTSKFTRKPLVLTPGDPAGIGPDITARLCQPEILAEFSRPLVIMTDQTILQERAELLGISAGLQAALRTGLITIHHLATTEKVIPGEANPNHAEFILSSLKRATQACLAGEFAGLITGPVSKAVINAAGMPFQGHTGYLAELSGAARSLMLFVQDDYRVALLTTHIPLKDVPSKITADNLERTLSLLEQGLRTWFDVKHPRIVIAGLNPHAGENGYMGREEIEMITPLIHALNQRGMNLLGPFAADTLLERAKSLRADAILSLYHDQTLPVLKALSFGDMVNVTLGLPFLRTSVDHGTAFELAGTGLAKADSLITATRLALRLVEHHA
jgi:4-hydroxythreonine-4-phosphate dehydrogenase